MPPKAEKPRLQPAAPVEVEAPTEDSLAEAGEGAGGPSPEEVAPALEAILLTLDRPVTAGRIAEALKLGIEQGGTRTVKKAVEVLNGQYEATGRAFRIEQVAGGFRVMTLSKFAPAVGAFQEARNSARLSRAAVETLAVIAYRQPITRAQIESIRGVACGEVLRSLLERRLIAIVGRAEELGRPMLYGVSRQFLELFGLSSVKDLPSVEDLMPSAAADDDETTDA
ncbi:MAG: SMC-Scp complex subunit ScpB [Phycisphaerales bacterium]|nr:SMC-Scp complex subunit ScpB [Phycisphaerales bacterium]